jgi:O-acetyl-ADP-ribose deacetylase (regulator of RNase III)
MVEIVQGNLITIAKDGEFDVIAHGCNCFCLQGAGIAEQMSMTFNTSDPKLYPLEHQKLMGDINKLGQVQASIHSVAYHTKYVEVVNCYTQFQPGRDISYEALTLCMKKLNHYYKGKKLGLPLIGCGIAGGKWSVVKDIFEKEFVDCNVTIVEYRA